MAEEAQRKLEAERDDMILAAQEAMVQSIQQYTDQLEASFGSLEDLGQNFGRFSRVMQQNEDKVQQQIDAIVDNTGAIEELTEQLKESSGPTVISRGRGITDTSFLGV
jgi:glucosamine 6-phosphate synthetase-like amidotransferase/phosphosugar isomerase protein